MIETNPHQISIIKIILLASLVLLLCLGIIGLTSRPNFSLLNPNHYLFLHQVRYLLLIAVLIFNLKMFTLQKSNAYLCLIVGCSSALFFHLFGLFYGKDSTSAANQLVDLLYFEQAGYLVFYFFLCLSIFRTDQIVKPGKERKSILFISAGAILVDISMLILLLLFSAMDAPALPLDLTVVTALAISGAAFLFVAGIKGCRRYFLEQFDNFYWFTLSIVFFLYSELYFLFGQSFGDAWYDASLMWQFVGFSLLVWTYFVGNAHFLEIEAELRSDLEHSLFQSERGLRELKETLNGLDAGICELDKDGAVQFFNEKFAAQIGYPAKQLKLKRDKEIIAAADLEKYQIELEKLKAGCDNQFEILLHCSNGENIPVLISAAPIQNSFKQFGGCRLVVCEIIEKKEAEGQLKELSENLAKEIKEKTTELQAKTEELAQAKSYYETLIAGMLDILLVVDKKGNCTFVNRYGQQLLGYQAKELTSKRLPDFLSDLDRLRQNYGDAMKVELSNFEAPLKTKDGRTIVCSWQVRYMFNTEGKNVGAMCVGRDISDFRAMQQQVEAHSRNREKMVAERTHELKVQVEHLSKILKVSEELTLNLEPKKMLTIISKVIKSLGWQIVICTVKDEETNEFKIIGYEGLDATRIRRFVYDRDFLYKDVFKFVKEEFRISKSYLKKNARQSAATVLSNGQQLWENSDVLIIPIKMKTKILGFFNLFLPTDKKVPDEKAVQVLESFANKAAVALENRRLLADAEARARELSKSGKIKTDFFTTMSHEVRTPLNSIISLTDILAQGLAGKLNVEQKKQVKLIQQNGRELLKLINNVLDFSKIDAEKMEVSYSYFSLINLINENVDMVRSLCQQKKLKLKTKLVRNLPTYIFNDSDKLSRILSNLLANAVKFTHKGHIKLEVKFDKKKAHLIFSISDTGIGMTKAEMKNIFVAYSQARKVDRRKYLGTGLGLAITKKMVELLGGEIAVESSKSNGSTFRFFIPIKDFQEEVDRQSDKSMPLLKKITHPASRTSKAKKSPLILLVDDNQDNQYAAKFILEGKGYRVLFASNGKQGIKTALRFRPDLILMDMMMPGIDGYQATKKIRQHAELKKTPIIAMTAKTAQEDKKKAIIAGCNEYLSKPFSLDAMLAKVHKWIGEKNGRQ